MAPFWGPENPEQNTAGRLRSCGKHDKDVKDGPGPLTCLKQVAAWDTVALALHCSPAPGPATHLFSPQDLATTHLLSRHMWMRKLRHSRRSHATFQTAGAPPSRCGRTLCLRSRGRWCSSILPRIQMRMVWGGLRHLLITGIGAKQKEARERTEAGPSAALL